MTFSTPMSTGWTIILSTLVAAVVIELVWRGEGANAWYKVASSDYLQRGSGYETLANNRNEQYRAEEIRDVIRLYAVDPAFTQKATQKRWEEVSAMKV